MKWIILLFTLLMHSYVRCQCFTKIDSFAAQRLEEQLHKSGSRNYGGINPIVRLALHRVNKTDGTGGMTWTEINDWVSTLPAYFAEFNICFTVISQDNVNNDDYLPFSSIFSGPANDLSLENRVENAINVYFLGVTGTGGGLAFGGWLTRGDPSKFPSIFLARERPLDLSESQLNTATFAHEMGHVLGLYHTHEVTLFGVENVQRTGVGVNCATTGDLLCGTPADPGLNFSYTLVNDVPDCTYAGSATLGGYSYAPDVRNIMSSSLVQCINHFSADQGARMLDLLQTTSYLDNQVVPWDETVTASLPTVSQYIFYYSVQNNLTVSEDESTTFTVTSGGNVTLEAANKVVLQPGFKASSGSSVLVRIGEFPCNSPSTVNSAKTDETSLNGTKPDRIFFSVYPNPANTQLFIETSSMAVEEINIYNINGSLVSHTNQVQNKSIDVSQLSTGVYMAEIKTEDASVKRRWVKM